MYEDDNEGGFDPLNQSTVDDVDDYNQQQQQATQTPNKKGATNKGKRQISNDTKQITPITIRQIFSAKQSKDDTFEIDGAIVSLVTFVGKIISVIKKENMTSYMLDDSTGIIEVNLWANNDTTSKELKEALL
jgi:hypothetical protein